MMRWIVGSSLKFRFLVVGLAAAMMVFGSGQLRAMPVDVFPEFAPPKVEIQTACLGLSAADVEALVTVPLEQALNGVPGLDVMRSKSVPQFSSIVMIFEPGTDLMTARQLVQERMPTVTADAAHLGRAARHAAAAVVDQPVMKIGLSSDELSTDRHVDDRLLEDPGAPAGVPGVANVAIWGERLQMLQVQVDPERMLRATMSRSTR